MNFEQARFNMIEQQIRPWEVLDIETLETVARVKREDYVPAAYKNLAFSDLEIPLTVDGVATGEAMFSPKMEARLLQEVAPKAHDEVLEIGAGSGYMAALLAARSARVESWEIHPALAAFAQRNLTAGGVPNAKVLIGDGFAGTAAANRGYDVIVLSGAVEVLPQPLMHQLKLGGRLAAIVGQAPVMSAVLVTRLDETQFDQVRLFETLVKPLAGGPRAQRFKF
jgi:protein-L-isoaspartate(D-aspartate) O-methyltransferase